MRLAELLGLLVVVGGGIAGMLAALGITPFHASASGPRSGDRVSLGATPRFDGSWQTGDNSQWSGLECPDPGRQFQVVPAPGRPGAWATRFEVAPGDVWTGNGSVRCLDARYDTGERAGQERYFALSLYVPAPGIRHGLVWELHHPASLYTLHGCGVAPFALLVDRGSLVFRVATGDCRIGDGWTVWHPRLTIGGFDPLPVNTWVDVAVHIRFTEQPAGLVEVWARRQGQPWPARPLIRRTGIPTLPYSRAAGVDGVRLYTEVGLYKGGAAIDGPEVAYLSGYRRARTFAEATAPVVALSALPALAPAAPALERLPEGRP